MGNVVYVSCLTCSKYFKRNRIKFIKFNYACVQLKDPVFFLQLLVSYDWYWSDVVIIRTNKLNYSNGVTPLAKCLDSTPCTGLQALFLFIIYCHEKLIPLPPPLLFGLLYSYVLSFDTIKSCFQQIGKFEPSSFSVLCFCVYNVLNVL